MKDNKIKEKINKAEKYLMLFKKISINLIFIFAALISEILVVVNPGTRKYIY